MDNCQDFKDGDTSHEITLNKHGLQMTFKGFPIGFFEITEATNMSECSVECN